MSTTKFYVRVDRTDGSRTYKGPWVQSHCEREANAWRESFPEYVTEVLPVAQVRDDVRRFSKVTAPVVDAPRYYPGANA